MADTYGQLSFSKFKTKNQIFEVGDLALIFNDSEIPLVGKILEFNATNGIASFPCLPSVKVQWFFRKSDINRVKNGLESDKKYGSLSDYELFPSKETDVVLLDTILAKLTLLTFDEYEQMTVCAANVYFSRAEYDAKKQLLVPRYSEWEKQCKCLLPINPEQLYLNCDGCKGWFHPTCLELDMKQAEATDEFFCFNCEKSVVDENEKIFRVSEADV